MSLKRSILPGYDSPEQALLPTKTRQQYSLTTRAWEIFEIISPDTKKGQCQCSNIFSEVAAITLAWKPRRKKHEVRMTTRYIETCGPHVSIYRVRFRHLIRYPLKEVIQPQVPLRLPCYDFTPVAVRSVGGCLPCGLAHRLRVQTTPMVWRAVCTRPGNVFTAACWSAITSDSGFMESGCRLQSELRKAFWDLLGLAASRLFVPSIVARV